MVCPPRLPAAPRLTAAPVRLGIVTLPVTLLDLPTDELTAMAREVRDAATGTRVTYSPKVFIPLTRLCRDRCGYCTFATAPHHIACAVPVAGRGAGGRVGGCGGGLPRGVVHAGRGPGGPVREAADWLAEHGYASTVDYLAAMAGLVLEETGLLPHANAGAVSREELARLRTVAPSQGMMIESLRRRPGRPPRRPGQDPGAPAGDPRGGRRARHPVHHRDPRRHRRVRGRPARRAGGDRRRAPPARSRAGGDRPELPAQAGHRDARRTRRARPRTTCGRSRWPG